MVAIAALMMITAASCGRVLDGDRDESGATSDTTEEGRQTPAASDPSTTDDPAGSGGTGTGDEDKDQSSNEAPGPAVTPCPDLSSVELATAAGNNLTETSGLVASQRHPGVLWATNDSGTAASVVAVDLDGVDLGRHLLPIDVDHDIEDLALVDGVLYLADIGDNNEVRDEITIYRFAEPDPFDAAGIQSVDVLSFRYPDGPRDAEAFLVDPDTGQFIIIEKAFGVGVLGSGGLLAPSAATVYVADGPFGPMNDLRPNGTVALDALAPLATAPPPPGTAGALGVSGVATGADIRADGALIALRTYATVWLFDRSSGQTVAEALTTSPCEAPTRPEDQGEAVAFLDDTSRHFVTIGEGANPAINLTAAPAG